MKSLRHIPLILTSLLFIGAASGCAPCPECPEPTAPPPVSLCVGFREYGPGHSFSNPYDFLGFTFSISPGPAQFETVTIDDLSGLKIESNGLRVDLPMATDRTWIQAAVPRAASVLTIDAIDDQKNSLHQAIIPNDATLHQVTITRETADIFHLTFNGGDGTAVLIEICIDED